MIEKRSIQDLTPDERNANRGNQRGRKMIRTSLERCGAGRSILLDRNLNIIAGDKTASAAREMGMEEIILLHTRGDQLVGIVRDDLDLKDGRTRARELAYLDNRTGQVGLEWVPEMVEEDLEAGVPLLEYWTSPEMEELLAAKLSPAADPDSAPAVDRALDLQRKWQTAPGQLWTVGGHRLFCGDATNADMVARLLNGEKPTLMVTDPPYGVEYDPEWRTRIPGKTPRKSGRRTGKVANDDRADWTEAWRLSPADIVYCWHGGNHSSEVQRSLEESGFIIRNQIIWAKPNLIISRGHYHWQHEPCWYAVRTGAQANWNGGRNQSTVWNIPLLDDASQKSHGTQKPVECMQRGIRNHRGDVYDPFCGSGTTIVAAAREHRRCYAMEIDPAYVAVTLERMTEHGLEPVLEAV